MLEYGLIDQLKSLEKEDEEIPIEKNEEESLDLEDILAKAAAHRSRRKDIQPVDHESIDYEPFRKDFYVEPLEIASMTAEEIDLLRVSLDDIKIRGLDCPLPITKWTHCGLPAGWYIFLIFFSHG